MSFDFAQGGPRVETTLATALASSANASGGWGYYAGKASRIEPTCWSLLALGAAAPAVVRANARAFLQRCQQPGGWLVEDAHVPINIAFNGLAATLWHAQTDLATDDMRRRLLAALVGSKGIQAAQSENVGQDNSLQGWSWTDGTFSWVEPTSWGLLALKFARRAGGPDAAASARIAEAEKLLINRCCKTGGWNYGNAEMMHQDLRAFVPTTALGLLAMQDRRNEPAVAKSLSFLESHWRDETSAVALGLATIALRVYGRSTADIEKQLREEAPRALAFGNLHGVAIALSALNGVSAEALRLR